MHTKLTHSSVKRHSPVLKISSKIFNLTMSYFHCWSRPCMLFAMRSQFADSRLESHHLQFCASHSWKSIQIFFSKQKIRDNLCAKYKFEAIWQKLTRSVHL